MCWHGKMSDLLQGKNKLQWVCVCVCVYLKHQPINAYEKVLKGHTLCTSVHLNLYYRSLFFISEKYFFSNRFFLSSLFKYHWGISLNRFAASGSWWDRGVEKSGRFAAAAGLYGGFRFFNWLYDEHGGGVECKILHGKSYDKG